MPLFVSIRDSSSRKVVGRHFDLHAVPRKYPDKIHPHLAGDVRKDEVSVLQLNAEHRVGKRFNHGSFHFNGFFFHTLFMCISPLVIRGAAPTAVWR